MPYRGKRFSPTALCLVALILACGDDATEPQIGSIQVGLNIDGAAPDADGCLVSVDGADTRRLLDGESYVFGRLSTGTHSVAIFDVASNCAVQGERSRSVTVSANATVFVRFALDCPALGTITVTTTSIGSAIDADGFTVSLDGANAGIIGANDSVVVDVAVGQYHVELTGLADNCGVIGENPVSVTIVEEDATKVSFEVSCPPYYDYIAFSSSRGGGTNIYVMEPDGSRPTRLTDDTHTFDGEPYPSWSPDATSIAYAAGNGINVLNTANMTVRRIASPGSVGLCDWSPDGSRIVHDSFGDIYVVNADGTNPVNLTPGPDGGIDPAWSPDGSQIAFTSSRLSDQDIYVMDADGSNKVRLTDLREAAPAAWWWPAYEPAWSPDGTRIAFVGPSEQASTTIWVMNSDGSNLTKITDDLLGYQAWRPSWSPDGSGIAYWVFRPDDGYCYQVYVMDEDGSNPTNITNHESCNTVPDWSSGS